MTGHEPNPYNGVNAKKPGQLLRTLILARCEHRCEIAWDENCTGNAAQLHHVLPRDCGGLTSTANLIGACEPCHVEVHRHRNVVRAHKIGVLAGALTMGELIRLAG